MNSSGFRSNQPSLRRRTASAAARFRARGMLPAAVIGVATGVAAVIVVARSGGPAPNGEPPPQQQRSVLAIPAWEDDLQRAAVRAGVERKDLLVLFTNGDTDVGPLQAALARGAANAGGHVMARVDVGTHRASPAALTLSAAWVDRLAIAALPCVVVFDAELKPFYVVRTPGSRPDLESELAKADAAKSARDAFRLAAGSASGVARARHLDAALSASGDEAVASWHPELMEEIVGLDADGSAGLRAKYGPRVTARATDRAVQEVVYPMIDAGDLGGAADQLARIERDVATSVSQKQLLLAFQGQLRVRLGMRDRAVALMDLAISLDPSSDEAAKIRAAKGQLGT